MYLREKNIWLHNAGNPEFEIPASYPFRLEGSETTHMGSRSEKVYASLLISKDKKCGDDNRK